MAMCFSVRKLRFVRGLYLWLVIPLLLSCQQDDTIPLDPEIAVLLPSLEQELVPLHNTPLQWSDDELSFLDPVADRPIVALGESTHGTAEFFRAKHRIFQYLVEQHGYKVFAFEADFGESLFIEEAIQDGRISALAGLMSEKMHFWTWRTREVQDLLEWMTEYNLGKAPEEKVHYVGVDCQFNTHHPELLRQYLLRTDVSFLAFANTVLDEAETASEAGFESYSQEAFDTYLAQVDSLQDSLSAQQDQLVALTSEKDFKLHQRLLKVLRQVSEVRYHNAIRDYSVNYRDQYMAENTAWMLDYYEGEKVVLWAHNAHIARDATYGSGSIGHYLSQDFAEDYTTVGFMFSLGEFTAVGYDGEQSTGLGKQTISVQPQNASLNEVFHRVPNPAFAIEVAALQKHAAWNSFFAEEPHYLLIGAVFNGQSEAYYRDFSPDRYDRIIYFDVTSATVSFR